MTLEQRVEALEKELMEMIQLKEALNALERRVYKSLDALASAIAAKN